MSRFEESDAFRIAKKAVKKRLGKRELRTESPLLGKEHAVLIALTTAEAAHDECQQTLVEHQIRDKRLPDSLEQHQIFLRHVKVAVDYWRGMSEQARRDLVHFRPQDLPMSEWYQRSIPQELQTFEANLYEIERAAQGNITFDGAPRRGRKPWRSQSGVIPDVDLSPLTAFVASLATFWERETGQPCGQHFRGSEAISAAANFVDEAVQVFKIYTTANVQTVMKMIQRREEHPSSYYEGSNCLVNPVRTK